MTDAEQKAVDKMAEIISTAFAKLVGEDRLISQGTVAESCYMVNKLLAENAQELGLPMPDELKFKGGNGGDNSLTMVPADSYTAFVMYCGMNGGRVWFTRDNCPEVLELQDGTRIRWDSVEDKMIIQIPKPLESITVNFAIDAYGDIKGRSLEKENDTWKEET